MMTMGDFESALSRVNWPDAPTSLNTVDDLVRMRRVIGDQAALGKANDVALLSPILIDRLLDANAEQLLRSMSDAERESAVDAARGILATCFSVTPVKKLLTDHHGTIFLALSSDFATLKAFLLKQISLKVAENPSSSVALLSTSAIAIVVAVVRHLTTASLASTSRAALVAMVGAVPDAPESILLHPSVSAEFTVLLQCKESEARFRVHDTTAELAKISRAALDCCGELGLVSALVGELANRGDILGQLNALELMAQMASDSVFVADFFHSVGVIPRLHDSLTDVIENPDAGFLFPAIIRFFGYLARAHPSSYLEQFPKFLQSVFDLVHNFDRLDASQRVLGFDTLAVIGSTPQGKSKLAAYPSEMKTSMERFGQAIRGSPVEMRARHLEALHLLLTLPPADQTEELLAIVQEWFSSICDDPMNFVFRYYKEPIDETRVVAGTIIKSLAEQAWGQRMLSQTDGFVDYLLDRGTERAADGRRLKYDIVCTLVDSSTAASSFDPSDMVKLKLYQREGPFFVQAEHQLAMESGN